VTDKRLGFGIQLLSTIQDRLLVLDVTELLFGLGEVFDKVSLEGRDLVDRVVLQASHGGEGRKLDGVTGSGADEVFVVSHLLGTTLFSSSNVDFVTLETGNLLVEGGKDPGTLAETGGFKAKADAEEDVDQRIGQELKGEGGGNQLPRDGSGNGQEDGTKETKVEEFLKTVRDTEDVLFTVIDFNGSDTGDDEHARDNAKLTANHETGKVLATALEEKFAGLLGKDGVTTFVGGDTGDGEESNLHTFEETNDAHEDKEENHGDTGGDLFPDGSLAGEESIQSGGEAETEDSKRHKTTGPEEGGGETITRGLVGLNGLSGHLGDEDLDNVGSMQQAGELNRHGDVESEDGKVVVDVVKHARASVDLGVELTDHAGKEDHAKTRTEEHVDDPVGESPEFGVGVGTGGHVDGKDGQDNHELATQKVAVEVVTGVGELGRHVGLGVGLLEEFSVDGGKTDQGTLASFHHREPGDGTDEDDKGKRRVDVARDTGLTIGHQSEDQRNREGEETARNDSLDKAEAASDSLVRRHG
jgi:hypothetical protein